VSGSGIADDPRVWPVIGTREIYRDAWVVALREDIIQRPGHPEETFGRLVIEHPGAVVVLAVDDEERVCCIRQYRHAGGAVFVELPAGILDAVDEDPQVTAGRELREEVELQAEHWRRLLTLYPTAGITSELHHIYLARGLSHADQVDFALRAEEADIDVLWVPFPELLDAVLDERVREGPLAAAVLAYEVLRSRGQL